jgi:hypothetical protein
VQTIETRLSRVETLLVQDRADNLAGLETGQRSIETVDKKVNPTVERVNKLFHRRNLDACPPLAPTLLHAAFAQPGSGLAQLRLRSCSPCFTLLTAPWRSQGPSHYKLSAFNEGPERRLGVPKMGPLHIRNLCLLKTSPALCLCPSVNL